MNSIFFELGAIIILATFLAILMRLVKQPPLIAYIITGVIVGPLGAHLLSSTETFDLLKEIGIALLLFLIGLELDWSKARHLLRTTFALGSLLMLISFSLGFGVSYFLKEPLVTCAYIGACLSFSSTIVVVKILSEQREANALHGRLAIGLSIFQDVAAIAVLVVMGGLAIPSGLPPLALLGVLAVKAVALLFLVWTTSTYLLPSLFKQVAYSQELLFLASLAWCFGLSILLSYFGFPLAIGAFLSGISLAALPYSLDIVGRLRSLRDFFVIIFFVSLGTSLQLPNATTGPLTVLIVALAVLVKPALVFIGLSWQGYKNRTSFLASLSQAPLSEFSLLLIELGRQHNLVSNQVASSIAFATIISILIATILLNSRIWLYKAVRPFLHFLSYGHRNAPRTALGKLENHIVIFGYHRMGFHILRTLQESNCPVVVVDFNPDIIHNLQKQGVHCLYGDVQDEDVLEQVNAEKASLIISTIPHREETNFLIHHLDNLPHCPILIVTSNHIDDALEYYKKGIDYVILPHLLGGEQVAQLIGNYDNNTLKQYLKKQSEDLKLASTRNHALYYE